MRFFTLISSKIKNVVAFIFRILLEILKFLNRKRWGLIAILHALILLVVTYVWLNQPFDYDAGEEHLTLFTFAEEYFQDSYKYDENFDSIVFINIAYDKVLVPKNDDLGLPAGEQILTDRRKLTKLLSVLSQNNLHKLVFFDIDFDEEYAEDSIMGEIMGRTKNFYLPMTTNKYIEKEQSVIMAAVNGNSTVLSGTFLKYPYIINQQKSIPVKFFELIDGGRFEKKGPVYCRNGQLAFRSIVPTFYFKKFSKYNENMENNYYDLGADLLWMNPEDLEQKFKDKIVLVGDFAEYDQHDTFVGKMPGTLILLNAYINLKYGNNHISFWMILIFFVTYFLLTNSLIEDRSLIKIKGFRQWMLKHRITAFFVRLLSIGFVFLLLTVISMIFFKVYLNVLILAIYFTLFGSVAKSIIAKFKKQIEEKV